MIIDDQFIRSVNEDGKVAMSLVISEIMLEGKDISDKGYSLGREALDCCWEWLESKEIGADDLCDYIDNRDGDIDLSTFAYSESGMQDMCTWHVLLYTVSYTAWQAYSNEGDWPPQSLDSVDDEILITIAETAIKCEEMKSENANRVKCYLLENYPSDCISENRNITKEEIMKIT